MLIQANAPRKPIRLAFVALFVLGLFLLIVPCLSTSTFCGRIVRWGTPDFDDYKRMPQRVIEHDETAVFHFTPATSTSPLHTYKVEGEPLTAFLERTDTTAFIVIQDDQLLYEGYFNGYAQADINHAYSATKSFLSALIGIAIDEGHIASVTDPVTNYIPELGSAYDGITLRHLLQMQSGIAYSDPEILGVAVPWGDGTVQTYGTDLRQSVLGKPIIEPPATTWDYNSTNSILLGMVLERATGLPIGDYLEAEIWRPLGMAYPAIWSVDSEENGLELSGKGLYARPIDFAKFGRLMANNGSWNGQQIISEAWVRESTLYNDPNQLVPKQLEALIPQALVAGEITADFAAKVTPTRYQYHWWGYEKNGRYDFAAVGYAAQFIYISPDSKTVIVRNGTTRGGLQDPEWNHLFFELVTNLTQEQ
ncbi:MAG: serine hydrolase domain-containing protein [Chloroflexota bacterium]